MNDGVEWLREELWKYDPLNVRDERTELYDEYESLIPLFLKEINQSKRDLEQSARMIADRIVTDWVGFKRKTQGYESAIRTDQPAIYDILLRYKQTFFA
jgi:hypothetical protein